MNPLKYSNLLQNRNKLLTPFDIHATIRDLSCLESKESNRSISLLNSIPSNRTCESIGISQHYCLCLEWFHLNSTSPLAENAAKFTIKYLNSLTKQFTECKKLQLESILSSQLSSIGEIIYILLKITTFPNQAMYELQVEYLKKDFIIRSPDEITRINSYRTESFCHDKLSSLIDIRKFCSCKE